jgi:hypothetical protein
MARAIAGGRGRRIACFRMSFPVTVPKSATLV